MYDFLIVGAGLFGAVIANKLNSAGKKILLIEKRNHIAGNIYTEFKNNIHVHKYGAHIFHTNYKNVWDFVNNFSEFNRYTHTVLANFNGEIYSLPFNMFTFNKMWGVNTPEEAQNKINEQIKNSGIDQPKNLEEQAIKLVGHDIYNKLIKGYTEKQWGRDCKNLPAEIIKRLPVRFIYDTNYYNAKFQGIPINGYTAMIEKMLNGIEVKLNCDFLNNKNDFMNIAHNIIFTGPIDSFFNFELGQLEYRTLKFEEEFLNINNFQGHSVINYTDKNTPFTRIIEHKHFLPELKSDNTIITREYSLKWNPGDEPYYPVNDEKNNNLHEKYKLLAQNLKNIFFGGRLGEYKYYDMDQVIFNALNMADKFIYN